MFHAFRRERILSASARGGGGRHRARARVMVRAQSGRRGTFLDRRHPHHAQRRALHNRQRRARAEPVERILRRGGRLRCRVRSARGAGGQPHLEIVGLRAARPVLVSRHATLRKQPTLAARAISVRGRRPLRRRRRKLDRRRSNLPLCVLVLAAEYLLHSRHLWFGCARRASASVVRPADWRPQSRAKSFSLGLDRAVAAAQLCRLPRASGTQGKAGSTFY